MPYNITFDPNPSQEDIQILGDGIIHYAKQQKGQGPLEFFTFFIRDEHQKILGGCSGNTLYGSLSIGYLWVDNSLRHQSYGTQLVQAALEFGKRHDCTFATVNTMDWEAREFYIKLGFEIEFIRHGFLNDSSFYFLRKSLEN